MSGRNVKRTEVGILGEQREAEDLLIEFLRSGEVVNVEAGFLQIGKVWHQSFRLVSSGPVPGKAERLVVECQSRSAAGANPEFRDQGVRK